MTVTLLPQVNFDCAHWSKSLHPTSFRIAMDGNPEIAGADALLYSLQLGRSLQCPERLTSTNSLPLPTNVLKVAYRFVDCHDWPFRRLGIEEPIGGRAAPRWTGMVGPPAGAVRRRTLPTVKIRSRPPGDSARRRRGGKRPLK
jgi:hypothetical protein